MQLSVAESVYIASSKGAIQLPVLYIRTLGNIQGNVLYGIPFYFSPEMYSQQLFSGNMQKFQDKIWKACSRKLCLAISYSRWRSHQDFVNCLSKIFFVCFLCFKQIEIIKIQHIPREGGWMQPYILTRMLVRPVTLFFENLQNADLFIQNFSLNRDILKSQKNWIPGYFSTF